MANDLLVAIEELLDRKLETLLERKLEEVLERKLEELFDRKLEAVLDRKLNERFAVINRRLDSLETKVEALDKRLGSLETKVEGMDKRLGSVETQMDIQGKRLQRMELVLENEIRPNIMRVAEGHIDLKRTLDDALGISNKLEKIEIKVNYHDMEIRNLKEAWLAT